VSSSLHTAVARQAPTLSGRIARFGRTLCSDCGRRKFRRLINMNEARQKAVRAAASEGVSAYFAPLCLRFIYSKWQKQGSDITAQRRLSPHTASHRRCLTFSQRVRREK
jgi:hypothetical protein